MISFFDTNIGAGGGGSDLTNRPWFTLFDDVFSRWNAVSGLSFAYEPNDDGQAISNSSIPRGLLGVRGDVRIGGHSIDGQAGSNTLGYNWSPEHGDMVLDTDNISFFSTSANNYVGLRNVVAHEFGHGLGISHHESNNSNNLMEPFISSSFDGPQIDDIHQAQRRYGDQFEEAGGNNSTATATILGNLTGSGLMVGSDANQGSTPLEVTPAQTDFLTIDDNTDLDVFQFTLATAAQVSINLQMVGPTYNRGPEGGSQSTYDLSMLSDLDLQLIDSDGTSVLGQSNSTGLGVAENINMALGPGNYFVSISGRDNDAQFYQLSLISAVPEPSTVILLGLLLASGAVRIRKRQA